VARVVCREDDNELDAEDTVDSWDAQMAEQAAWEAAMEKSRGGSSAGSDVNPETGVDEEAHFGLGDDDDETPAERTMRQLAEKQASVMLSQFEASRAPPENTRVMTSLSAVLTVLARLEDKVDRLSARVEALAAEDSPSAPPPPPPGPPVVPSESSPAAAPPASPPAPDYSWEVDETAWFDDDGDAADLADWRDVRRLKRLLEKEAPERETGAAEPPQAEPPQAASGKAGGVVSWYDSGVRLDSPSSE